MACLLHSFLKSIFLNVTFITIRTRRVMYIGYMDRANLLDQIKELESKLSGDMFKDMDIREEIHQLKMKLNGVQPDRKEANTLYCNC
jgi:hypothetical protein